MGVDCALEESLRVRRPITVAVLQLSFRPFRQRCKPAQVMSWLTLASWQLAVNMLTAKRAKQVETSATGLRIVPVFPLCYDKGLLLVGVVFLAPLGTPRRRED